MLTVDAASYSVAGRVLVDRVSFAVRPGEKLAIVGPNGAGKTTLLRLLSGFLRPKTGEVRLGGRPLDAMTGVERARHIAVVAQIEAADGRSTVLDHVGLGRLPHEGRHRADHDRSLVAAAIDRVGLGPLAGRRLSTLSGGERQRADLARALAQTPRILLLDEPTNHLDPRARIDLLALARAFDGSVVAVLHDLALVAAFADRVAVIDRGRLAALGPPDEALSPALTREVFAMNRFIAVDPHTGRSVLVFDAAS